MFTALQLIGITLVALVVGIYWGPWVALTRSIASLPIEVFLPVVRLLNDNLARLMTVLVPVALLAQVGLLIVDFQNPLPFTLAAIAFLLFVITVVVTVLIEVPIVKQFIGWQVETVPFTWMALRDRWLSFHLLRVIPGVAALVLYLAAAIL